MYVESILKLKIPKVILSLISNYKKELFIINPDYNLPDLYANLWYYAYLKDIQRHENYSFYFEKIFDCDAVCSIFYGRQYIPPLYNTYTYAIYTIDSPFDYSIAYVNNVNFFGFHLTQDWIKKYDTWIYRKYEYNADKGETALLYITRLLNAFWMRDYKSMYVIAVSFLQYAYYSFSILDKLYALLFFECIYFVYKLFEFDIYIPQVFYDIEKECLDNILIYNVQTKEDFPNYSLLLEYLCLYQYVFGSNKYVLQNLIQSYLYTT